MRWAVSPSSNFARIKSRNGSQTLRVAEEEPMGALAAFASAGTSEMPMGALAAFYRNCLETVSRSTPSSRAIRRLDQPRALRDTIASMSAILSRYAMGQLLPLGSSRRSYPTKPDS